MDGCSSTCVRLEWVELVLTSAARPSAANLQRRIRAESGNISVCLTSRYSLIERYGSIAGPGHEPVGV